MKISFSSTLPALTTPYFNPKTAKMWLFFDKTDFWDLKCPPEFRVEHKTCSTICRTPASAILNRKNLIRSAGGARESQNMAHLGHNNGPCCPVR